MAKQLIDVLNRPIHFITPDIRRCPCGCGIINRRQHAYIESRVTGHWYGDMECLLAADGARWEGNRIRDEFGELRSLDEYKRVMEVIPHG